MRSLVTSLLLLSLSSAQIIFPGEGGITTPKPTTISSLDEELNSALNITNRQDFFVASGSQSTACQTPAGEQGICGPLTNCQSYVPFVRQLGNPTVNKFFRERICRLLLRTVHICCPVGNPILPFTNPPQPSSIIPSEAECGIPSAAKVTGGTEVKPGFWPWLAAIGQRTQRNQFFANCGGSLITTRHVLTAAHCFLGIPDDPNLVRLGEHHLDHNNAGERPEEFRIAGRVSHSYDRNTNENDISLLTLDREVRFNDFIRPICLPFDFKNDEFVGQSLTVVGWGRTNFEDRRTSKVPMEAPVPVVPRANCVTEYQKLRKVPVIDRRQLCAGVGGQDSCNGDSGGPLNYLDFTRGRFYLVGIVSFGVQCARRDFPGVYTRVSEFIPWIEQNL